MEHTLAKQLRLVVHARRVLAVVRVIRLPDEGSERLADFDRKDLWPLVEAPPPGLTLRVVVAGQSTAVLASDRERLQAAAARGAIELFELPGAGHWLHADDPDGLLRLMLPYF